MFLGRRSLGEGGYTAKTFSVHRRVRNHYTKRILNLTLNRKKFLRWGNDPLAKQNCEVFGVCPWLSWMRRQDGDVPS